MIDLHCHILPGIDDGASDLEESLAMAKQAVDDGIQTIIATPHTLNDIFVNPLRKTVSHVERLRQSFQENKVGIELRIGSEVRIRPEMTRLVMDGEIATLNDGGKYLLVEFPLQLIPPGSREELFQLKLNHMTPILAHPERNPIFQDNPERLFDLVNMGCLVQITAMSITGRLGGPAMECAHTLLKHRKAHIIATDAHSSTMRPPILSQGVEVASRILGGMEEAEDMVVKTPRSILAGEPVDMEPPVPVRRKKRWFGFKR